MLMQSVPPHARRCGDGYFLIPAQSSALARVLAVLFETDEMKRIVRDVVLQALQADAGLLLQVSQMKWANTGFTLGAEPTEQEAGGWKVPFTAYVFEKP